MEKKKKGSCNEKRIDDFIFLLRTSPLIPPLRTGSVVSFVLGPALEKGTRVPFSSGLATSHF